MTKLLLITSFLFSFSLFANNEAARNCDELVKTEVLNAELRGYKAHDGLTVDIKILSKKEVTAGNLVYDVSINTEDVEEEEIDGEMTNYAYEGWSQYQLEVIKNSCEVKRIEATGRAG